MQRVHGIWAVLSMPRVYAAMQRLLAGPRVRQIYVDGHIRPAPGLDILDVGCGPGDIAPMMRGARYVGVDADEKQNPLARLVISLDRGQNVHWREPYERLFSGIFGKVRCSVYHDILRIPYTHIIVEAADPIDPSASADAREKSLAVGLG